MSNNPGLPFSLIADPAKKDEARLFATKLVDMYHNARVATPHLDTICLEFRDDFPSDELLDAAMPHLNALWRIEPVVYNASSGRAGCIWMTRKFGGGF